MLVEVKAPAVQAWTEGVQSLGLTAKGENQLLKVVL